MLYEFFSSNEETPAAMRAVEALKNLAPEKESRIIGVLKGKGLGISLHWGGKLGDALCIIPQGWEEGYGPSCGPFPASQKKGEPWRINQDSPYRETLHRLLDEEGFTAEAASGTFGPEVSYASVYVYLQL